MSNETPLSEKIVDKSTVYFSYLTTEKFLLVKDVREAVKEFSKELKIYGKIECGVHAGFLLFKLKEIFGKELCEGEK